ncbi:patatin family protein [Cutibacterium acnes]
MTTSIDGTALVLEGGGMRAAYTSAVIVKMLGLGWKFPHVSGISAGSSLTANYISRDPERTRLSFTDFAADPRFGNLGTWLAGRGYFDGEYIYQRTAEPHQALPFDFLTFCASSQAFRIGATRTSDGEQEWFTREDMKTMDDLMARIRASSTMPGFMPPVTIEGVEYVDGALGTQVAFLSTALNSTATTGSSSSVPGLAATSKMRSNALRRFDSCSDAVLASPRQPSHDQPCTTLPVSCCATSSQTGKLTSSIHASCP